MDPGRTTSRRTKEVSMKFQAAALLHLFSAHLLSGPFSRTGFRRLWAPRSMIEIKTKACAETGSAVRLCPTPDVPADRKEKECA